MTPSIFIAIPAYGGSLKAGCVISMIDMRERFRADGIESDIRIVDRTDIITARNVLASMFLESPHTLSLTIDADMEFRPETVMRMNAENTMVCGCAYPRRVDGGEFVIWHDDMTTLKVTNGAADVGGVGMGLCLIKRAVFETLLATGEIRKGGGNKRFGTKHEFGFYDRLVDDNGNLMPEDLSFCRRWRKTGGTIRALLNEDIGHVGDKTYRGNYLEHLKSSRSRGTETR